MPRLATRQSDLILFSKKFAASRRERHASRVRSPDHERRQAAIELLFPAIIFLKASLFGMHDAKRRRSYHIRLHRTTSNTGAHPPRMLVFGYGLFVEAVVSTAKRSMRARCSTSGFCLPWRFAIRAGPGANAKYIRKIL